MSDLNRNQLYGLKIRKNDAGITSQQIADFLGIAVAIVTAWEDGSIRIDASRAAAYARALKGLGA